MADQEIKHYEPLCKLPTVEKPDEYRVGEHRPPLFLIVLFVMVFLWAMVSWIPFFGY